MAGKRTFVNLVTVIIASSVLVLYALTELVAGAIFGQGYPLYIHLPEAGGLTENKQVTYRGYGIGHIADVDLEDDGVVVEMEINPGVEVPREVDVVVLRQSAVGEQALDMRPREATDDDTEFYEEEEYVDPLSVTLPTKPEDLLVLADRVFGSVDTDNAAKLIAELADTVRGRSSDIQSIMVDSASLSESVADNGSEYDRLFAASRIVNASLAANRQVLAEIITDFADSAQLVGDIRGDVEALLDTAPSTLSATTTLLERTDANLACVLRDLADLNEYVATEPHLQDLAETLRTQTWFFDAFRIIGPTSVQGDPWLRVHFTTGEPPPQRYEPERPIPDTLPGGACESAFGPGAGAAVQANHQLVVPHQSRVVRPPDDRQESAIPTTPPRGGLAARIPLPAPSAPAVDARGLGG